MKNKFEVGDLVKVEDEGEQYSTYSDFYEENNIPRGNFNYGRDITIIPNYENIVFTIKFFSPVMIYLIENKELKLEFIFGEEGLKLFRKKISKEKQLARDLKKFCKREEV